MPCSFAVAIQSSAFAWQTIPWGRFSNPRFSSKALAIPRSLSTKKTLLAPRDNASSPKTPLPANKSKQLEFRTSFCNQLNKVSLTRSPVGRIASFAGNENLRRRKWPEIIRTELADFFIARNPSTIYLLNQRNNSSLNSLELMLPVAICYRIT